MIRDEIQQDIFEAEFSDFDPSTTTVFFHGCNAQGVMGAGVAENVKEKWPNAYETYKKMCEQEDEDELVGGVVWHEVEDQNVVIANGITQKYYGKKGGAKLEWIESALDVVDSRYDKGKFRFVTVRVGTGLGGLEWKGQVRTLFEWSTLPWTVYYL